MRTTITFGISVVGLLVLAAAAPACGSDDDGSGEPVCEGFGCEQRIDSGGPAPGCIGLQCQQVRCEGGTTTTLSGTVFDPAGKVPIYNAVVYVPNAAPAAITHGAACDRCDAKVSGMPVVITLTDTSGAFRLENVPVGATIPLVVQIGKWRRQLTVPNVERCVNTAVDAGATRLPRNKAEGDLPRIAMATGAADPLQCLLKKMGVDDAEFGIAGSDASVHMFAGAGFTGGAGAVTASSSFAGGAAFPNAETLWNSLDELKKYDLVVMACEGTENDNATHKSPAAKQAVYDYAKAGGRVFTTHYHHTFFSGSPDAAPRGVGAWAIPEKAPPVAGNPVTTAALADIVGTFPKAVAMKEWLGKQNALDGAGKLAMVDSRHNVDGVNAGGLNWIQAISTNPSTTGQTAVQYLSFNAPVGAPDDQICGRVVFSNLHVGAGSEGALVDNASAPYPTSCQTQNLSAQQKALEFMLFDLSSCVQRDDAAVVNPK